MKATTLDLGYKSPYGSIGIASPEPGGGEGEKKDPTIYPSLTIEQKPGLAEALEVGQEITATVHLKVIGKTEREGGRYNPSDQCSIDFDVLSIAPEGVSISDEPDMDDAETALGKHFAENAE